VPTTETVLAPAKLTTDLRVVGVRPDGYHLIEATMVSLDLHDTLTIDAFGSGLTVDGAVSGLAVSADADNLVSRALKVVDRTAGVHLVKRIPAGAGLGGGSSDAAAVLAWAGCTDLGLAASIGADVAFCLRGGRALVTGVGEVVTELPFALNDYTLIIPDFGVSTPAVYAQWDSMGGPTGSNGNDLEPAAVAFAPELGRWRDGLGDATGQQPRLAGSGGTWFVDGHHEVVVGNKPSVLVSTVEGRTRQRPA